MTQKLIPEEKKLINANLDYADCLVHGMAVQVRTVSEWEEYISLEIMHNANTEHRNAVGDYIKAQVPKHESVCYD